MLAAGLGPRRLVQNLRQAGDHRVERGDRRQPNAVAAGAFFPVPDGPGLGVEVNEDAVRRQSFRYWNPPMLRRPDGSLTNW